jgi:hypothetical protein
MAAVRIPSSLQSAPLNVLWAYVINLLAAQFNEDSLYKLVRARGERFIVGARVLVG